MSCHSNRWRPRGQTSLFAPKKRDFRECHPTHYVWIMWGDPILKLKSFAWNIFIVNNVLLPKAQNYRFSNKFAPRNVISFSRFINFFKKTSRECDIYSSTLDICSERLFIIHNLFLVDGAVFVRKRFAKMFFGDTS